MSASPKKCQGRCQQQIFNKSLPSPAAPRSVLAVRLNSTPSTSQSITSLTNPTKSPLKSKRRLTCPRPLDQTLLPAPSHQSRTPPPRITSPKASHSPVPHCNSVNVLQELWSSCRRHPPKKPRSLPSLSMRMALQSPTIRTTRAPT